MKQQRGLRNRLLLLIIDGRVHGLAVNLTSLDVVLLVAKLDVLHEEDQDRWDDGDHRSRNEEVSHCESVRLNCPDADRVVKGIGCEGGDGAVDRVDGSLVGEAVELGRESAGHDIPPDRRGDGRTDGIADLSEDEDEGSDSREVLVRDGALSGGLGKDSCKATTPALDDLNDDELGGLPEREQNDISLVRSY